MVILKFRAEEIHCANFSDVKTGLKPETHCGTLAVISAYCLSHWPMSDRRIRATTKAMYLRLVIFHLGVCTWHHFPATLRYEIQMEGKEVTFHWRIGPTNSHCFVLLLWLIRSIRPRNQHKFLIERPRWFFTKGKNVWGWPKKWLCLFNTVLKVKCSFTF